MAFKMKKFSGFGNSPMKLEQEPEKKEQQPEKKMMKVEKKFKKTSKLPKIHDSQKSKLPTQEQRKAQQGTLKGLTQFEYDLKKVKPLLTSTSEILLGKKIAKGLGKVKKYFTEK